MAHFRWRTQRTTQTDSLTFRLIDDAYASFPVTTLIVEGPPYSRGANADGLIRWVESQGEKDGFLEGGEMVPSVRGARARGAAVWGGEPEDGDIRDRVVAKGFSLGDLLGFYTLRSVPQWVSERKIEGASDERVRPLIEAELEHNRQRLALPATVLSNYAAWSQWYARTNNKPFGVSFDPEETGPLADGCYGSNRIAESISHARDEFLVNLVANT